MRYVYEKYIKRYRYDYFMDNINNYKFAKNIRLSFVILNVYFSLNIFAVFLMI